MRKSILLLIALLNTVLLIGQTEVVTYSPSNPEVGDTVTFTITNNASSCSYQVDADANDATVVLKTLPGASHVYTAPGVYRVNLDEVCSDVAFKGSNNKVLVADMNWTLVDSDGAESTDKTITIVAGATAPPATVPTLGEWTLIILLITMLIVGVVFMSQTSDKKSIA